MSESEVVHEFTGPMRIGVSVSHTGSPEFRPTKPGGPKLVCVDLTTDTVTKVITFSRDVALETTYLNDVRFDLRGGEAGVACITDSADSGPNGIIVVDLDSGESWRRLHDHPSTKAEPLKSFRPVVEGSPFLERPADGEPKPVSMGSDGIAISADGSRLFCCALASRRWYSVPAQALLDRSLPDDEHNAVLRRSPDGTFETVAHDPRLLWPDTMSVAAATSTSRPTSCTGRRSTRAGRAAGRSRATCSACPSTPDRVRLR